MTKTMASVKMTSVMAESARQRRTLHTLDRVVGCMAFTRDE